MTDTMTQEENVYGEVLYCLLHVNKQKSDETNSIDQVFDYLKRAFQFDDDKHEKLLTSIRERPPPDVSQKLGAVKARILKGKEVKNFNQYEQLLRIIVEHEIRSDESWRGLLPEYLLRQFATKSGLNQSVTDVCSWSVYSSALHKWILDFTVLLPLIQRLRKALKKGKLSDEELVNMFWTATDSFIEAALTAICNVRKNYELNTKSQQLSALLECIKELNSMSPTRTGLSDIEMRIKAVITKGTVDWYSQVVKEQKGEEETSDDERLKNIIRICQALMTDLETVSSVHEPIFQSVWKIPVFSIVYLYYDGQLAESIKPVVDGISQSLKAIQASKENMISMAFEASGEVGNKDGKQQDADSISPRLTMGTALFELCLCLQRFHKLSNSLTQSEKDGVKLALFYTWFETAVDCWLDIALNKALIRIGKAVSLDDLETVDSMVKYSNSAVDTVTVFYQIKASWDQLAWPAENSLIYVNKVVEDVKQSSMFYIEAILLKLEKVDSGSSSIFFLSPKTCAVINNILYVQQSIEPLAEEIGYFKLNKNARCGNNDESSSSNPENVSLTDSAIKDINEKLEQIYISIARRFEVEVIRLIGKGKDSSVLQTDELNSFISNKSFKLGSHFPVDVLNNIYHHILQSFLNVIESEVKKKRQPSSFRQWRELLDVLDHCFRNHDAEPDEAIEDEILIKIRWLLKLHGMDTVDLIHLYRLERIKQMEGQDVGLGSLAVRVIFIDDEININILNARNLNAANDSTDKKKDKKKTKSVDPYVKVQLLPTHFFPDLIIQKSKVHKNTVFPLFEESFTFSVPKSLQTNEEGYVHFTVKDKNLLITNQIMGESFLNFQKITRGEANTNINELDQIMLPLTKPQQINPEYLNVLKGRTWDKTALEFTKKEKKRVKTKI